MESTGTVASDIILGDTLSQGTALNTAEAHRMYNTNSET